MINDYKLNQLRLHNKKIIIELKLNRLADEFCFSEVYFSKKLKALLFGLSDSLREGFFILKKPFFSFKGSKKDKFLVFIKKCIFMPLKK